MAVLSPQQAGNRQGEDQAERSLPGWSITLNGDQALFLLLVAAAAALRFWDLGSRAFHHDESLHAVYGWYLYAGRGYIHDPLMHGPFQFHGTALIYFLFGASDATARILPALFGTAMVGTPYFLRDYLGRTGALATAALIAFSPVLLYYSRFLREDTYVALWTVMLVICLWRYQADRQARYLYLGAAALALGFATKETTYLTVLVFGAYLVISTLPELLPRLRRWLDLRGISPRAEFMVMVGTLALPQGAAGVLLFWYAAGAPPPAPDGGPLRPLLIAGALGTLGIMSAIIGLRWRPLAWTLSVLVFFSIYVVLFTTFFTNPPGFISGIWGSLEYWLAQQEVRRGGQPWFYYLVLIPIYEFLPLAIVAAAAMVRLRRDLISAALAALAVIGACAAYAQHDGNALADVAAPDSLRRASLLIPAAIAAASGGLLIARRWAGFQSFNGFLVFWLAGGLLAYSYAGEKMPWLAVHLTLPVLFLAGGSIDWLLTRVSWRAAWRDGSALMVPLLLLTPLALGALALRRQNLLIAASGEALWELIALFVAGVLLLYFVQDVLRRSSPAGLGAMAAVTGLIVLGAFSIRTAWQASYYHGDIPVEMLVYTQTSPEIPKIMRDIEEVARITGEGKDLPITVDASEGFTWPWAWYLRDYTHVDYPALTSALGPPAGSVLLLDASNEQLNRPYLGKYGGGRRFPHRWWFPEEAYRGLTLEGLIGSFTDPATLGIWWRYLLYRELSAHLGSSEAMVYFPRDLSSVSLPLPAAPPPDEYAALSTDLRAAATIGVRGRDSGAFESPRGVAVDKDGNVFVADTLNHRIQKFDASGRFLVQTGSEGSGDAEFREPWGITVDRSGNVYVADTWNHRIQKLDSQLRLQLRWGDFANVTGSPATNPGRFFGPRAVAVDGEGNLWVTDTGNKRVQKFSPDGRFLAAHGGFGRAPGQFSEPSGIAVAPNDDLLVADIWNRRVQRFDRNFAFLSEFAVKAWPGEGLLNKPQIAVESNGNIMVTDPENHRLLRFSPQGALIAAIGRFGVEAGGLNYPTGLAVDGNGLVYVADGGNHRVLRLSPLP